MFKHLKIKKKNRPDMRFVDAETYRAQRKPLKHPALRKDSATNSFSAQNNPGFSPFLDLTVPSKDNSDVNVSFYRNRSGIPLCQVSESDEYIVVEEKNDAEQNKPRIIAEQKKDLFDLFVEESSKAQEIVEKRVQAGKSVLGPNYLCENSLGVFCDSKMYAALIRAELLEYRLDVRHFNHPNTFIEARYGFFDRISAWILFLSDDGDEHFIDSFLDRYSDTPTLFLCPKMSRRGTTERIREFIDATNLEKEIDMSDESLSLS